MVVSNYFRATSSLCRFIVYNNLSLGTGDVKQNTRRLMAIRYSMDVLENVFHPVEN